MLVLVEVRAKSKGKCCCCKEKWYGAEKYLQVQKDGVNVRGERYCLDCEEYAYENNPGLRPNDVGDWPADDEAGLRSREDYAAYRYAGCTDAYWTDRDAGYAH